MTVEDISAKPIQSLNPNDASVQIDSQYLNDQKKLIRERIIPWEGLARSNVISEDESNYIKILEKQSDDNKTNTVTLQLSLYSNTLIHLLNKLDVNSRGEVIKNILVLINDLLLKLPAFVSEVNSLNTIDSNLPFDPFLKHLDNSEVVIRTLAIYNLVLLVEKLDNVPQSVLIKIYLSLLGFIDSSDANVQFISVQLLLQLLVNKNYKSLFINQVLFDLIDSLVAKLNTELSNSSNLQLLYNTLLNVWILSFNNKFNKKVLHNYPNLIGYLLNIAKNAIKLKIVRLCVSTLKNFISVGDNSLETFKIIKIILFSDGLNTIRNLKERNFSSNGSDEELATDLNFLYDTLIDIVENKLTSFDEYLTELETPNLINGNSPTHKSQDFWRENADKFKDNNYKLVTRMFEILTQDFDNNSKIILLGDLQNLIGNLGQSLIDFINDNKDYKLLIMGLLDNNSDNELKYQALKTIQLLVGHSL